MRCLCNVSLRREYIPLLSRDCAGTLKLCSSANAARLDTLEMRVERLAERGVRWGRSSTLVVI